MDWKQCPSVTTGGKPFFLVCFDEFSGIRFKYTIMWDRVDKHWKLTEENMRTGDSKEHGTGFSTYQMAQRFFDQNLSQ